MSSVSPLSVCVPPLLTVLPTPIYHSPRVLLQSDEDAVSEDGTEPGEEDSDEDISRQLSLEMQQMQRQTTAGSGPPQMVRKGRLKVFSQLREVDEIPI